MEPPSADGPTGGARNRRIRISVYRVFTASAISLRYIRIVTSPLHALLRELGTIDAALTQVDRASGPFLSALQAELAALGGTHLGIVLKIETQRAFEELPRLLLTCMRTGRFGVMIAWGDLAIECGYERMAEVQEEILWIAEAAHAPVIWGTQVLESLAKTGVPWRAEVTDAAMAERAEAVMLNKGPFIRQAVRTLDDILRRMQAHQTKKRAMLRPLRVASLIADALGTPASR